MNTLVLVNLPRQLGEILAINRSGTFAVALEYYAHSKLSNVHVVAFLMSPNAYRLDI